MSEESKKPLQTEKQQQKEAILAEATTEKPKRGRPRKKPVPEVPVVDMAEIEREAKFFLDLIQTGREGLGVHAKIGDTPMAIFIQGYKGLVLKYGSLASKWMPEMLFCGAVVMISYDTYKEVKALKISRAGSKESDSNDIRKKGKRKVSTK